MKYCPTSTIVRNPASVQNCSVCLVVMTFQFVLDIFSIVILLVQDPHSKVCSLDHTWHEQSIRFSFHNGSLRSIVIGFIFFTHFCHCSVETELIYRSNCAKNSCNRFQVGTILDRQFSTTFAFELTSGQWTRGSKKLGVRFLRVLSSSFRPFCPIHLVDYLHW